MTHHPNLLASGALATILAAMTLPGCDRQRSPSQPTPPAAGPLESARKAYDSDDLASADDSIRKAMIQDPSDPAVLVLAARIASAQGRFRDALQIASTVDSDTPESASAQSIIAESAVKLIDELEGYEDVAWVAMESTLVRSPQRHDVRHALVKLLNRRGNRHRACEHIDWLCLAGLASKEELQAIVCRRDSFPPPAHDQSSSTLSQIMSKDGPLALARALYTTHDFSTAYDVLAPDPSEQWKHPEDAALFGEILAEKQSFDELANWYRSCPPSTNRYAGYWSAIGIWMIFEEEYRLAAGALLAAIEIDPTHVADYKRLGLCIAKLGDPSASQHFVDRGRKVSLLRANASTFRSRPKYVDYQELVAKPLNDLGRPFEFIRWQELMSDLADDPAAYRKKLIQQRSRLLSMPDYAVMSVQHRRMGLPRESFPPPGRAQIDRLVMSNGKAEQSEHSAIQAGSEHIEIPVAYTDVARDVGIDMQYLNHSPPTLILFRLHETLGGGIAVLDYDLDGWPDLYFGQGSGDPPHQRGDQSNRFYHNLSSHFVDQTDSALLGDDGYTTGIAAGDVNQDGFTDLYIGALGANRLLLNQGDGTFSDAGDLLGDVEPLFTASVAIADVTGDHLPDLIEANYVDDAKLYEARRTIRGVPTGLSPLYYGAARDRLYTSTPQGAFVKSDLEPDEDSSANSLGVMVTNIDSSPGNEIFIANDVHPNRYWVRPEGSQDLTEMGQIAGLALDYSGTSTAGMGVAAGDFDGNGQLDLHVTNFSQQLSSLFMQTSNGLFSDLAPRYGFDTLTYQMLGFGTQTLDIDRDGVLDLAILNGHIEDFTFTGHAFRMPPQILMGTGRRFEQRSVIDPTNYWTSKRLGRSLAKLDWNRDGRIDLAAVHLDAPTALLENRTNTSNHWLRLRLVGTLSERDAIGARVTAESGGRTWTQWRTAGDGYLCTNEPSIDFGIGGATTIDQVTVHWPSGTEQVLSNLAADRCYLVVEGNSITQE